MPLSNHQLLQPPQSFQQPLPLPLELITSYQEVFLTSTSPLPHNTHLSFPLITHLFLSSNNPADLVHSLNLHLTASCLNSESMYLSALHSSFAALYHLKLLFPLCPTFCIDLFNFVLPLSPVDVLSSPLLAHIFPVVPHTPPTIQCLLCSSVSLQLF